jgi:hypothetical protein
VALSSLVGLASGAAPDVNAVCAALLTGGVCFDTVLRGVTLTPTQCAAMYGLVMAPGVDDTESTNTVGCRNKWLNRIVAEGNNTRYCRYLGPSGAGMCGSVLDNTCDHVVALCSVSGITVPPYANAAACKNAQALGGVAAQWGSNQGNLAAPEDSLECRVYHSIVAWNGGAPSTATEVHCNHTLIPRTTGQCDGAVTANNNHHCDTIQATCTATGVKQYNTLPECDNSIIAFPNTVNDARAANGGNNQACRQYHAQAAASGFGIEHCYHGGPSGQGVCGGQNASRDSWNYISSNAACQTAMGGNLSNWGKAVAAAFLNWATADIHYVMPTSALNYTVAASGDNDFCRIYHCTVASTGGATNLTHCEHCAITSSQCFDPAVSTTPGIAAICRMIQAACGTSNFASVAACITDLTPVLARPGDVTSLMPAAADTFACRGYQAGVALAAKKSGTATTTACANAKVAPGPGCGGTAKSSAATLMVSVAVVLPFLAL